MKLHIMIASSMQRSNRLYPLHFTPRVSHVAGPRHLGGPGHYQPHGLHKSFFNQNIVCECFRRRPLSTAEILEIMENLEETDIAPDGIIIILPKDVEDNTDCYSGSEETNNPDNLNYNQLTAEGEFYFEDNEVRRAMGRR
ncbi:hypothetical protein ILUMI_10975 [Ignelater luminosus]|uniref:Uncharacterized protein n=1 Tax=Ignelater luminosus TaxID=2038154 RepID=A0A8K0D2A1_IGNLU|nr:hypothetical protein ILUMI_10975 [Ignelater luminosus]